MSHSSSYQRQGHIELNLKTLLQGIPVARLGFDPEQIPDNVFTQLPLPLIQSQLLSGRVDVSLRDVIDGCLERYRPAFAKASVDESISLPIEAVREQLPPSDAVLSPSDAESPFKPAGQTLRSPFSPLNEGSSPFKAACPSSGSPFSPARDDDPRETPEPRPAFNAPETAIPSPFASPSRRAEGSPFTAASGPAASPFASAVDEPAASPFTARSEPSPQAEEAEAAAPADAAPLEEDGDAAATLESTELPGEVTDDEPESVSAEIEAPEATETEAASPQSDTDTEADSEGDEPAIEPSPETSESDAEAIGSPKDEDFSSEDEASPETIASPSEIEEERKPLSPFAVPPGSAKALRRKSEEEGRETVEDDPNEKAQVSSSAEEADVNLPASPPESAQSRAERATPPSWPSAGLRDRNGQKSNVLAQPSQAAAARAAVKPAFDFGFEEDPKQLALRAIFETAEQLEVGDVLDRAATFQSLSACALIVKKTGESKFSHGADSKRDERFAQQAKQAYKKVIGLAEDLAITDAESFTLRTQSGAISFFNAPHVCLAVLHERFEFPPGIKEKLILIARDLSAMEA